MYILVFGVMLFCVSCSKKANNLSALQFGEVKSYTPEFGNQPFNKILTVPIELKFNQEAVVKRSFIELEWVSNNGGKPANINYFVNGTKMLDNNIRFNAKDFTSSQRVELGLQFKEGIEEGKKNLTSNCKRFNSCFTGNYRISFAMVYYDETYFLSKI